MGCGVRSVREGGCDVLQIETCQDLLQAKAAFAEAARLCARFVSCVRERPGGLALLADATAPPPGPEELAALLERAGFAEVSFRLLAGGIVALHEGQAR